MALFNKQDKKDKKKGLESTIGKIIYGFLLFAPLLSILTTCMYVVFNKNAYESYYGETINDAEYTTISNFDELIENDKYLFTSNNTNTINSYNKLIYIDNVEILASTGTETFNNDLLNATAITTTYYGTMGYLVPIINGTQKPALDMSARSCQFTFTLINETHPENTYNECWDNFLQKISYNKYSYLDNNFEYGVYKTEQSTLFNWSKSTGTYQVMETTTQGIGITNTFIPMLMTYWLLISVIYFIYDIALVLIMMVHKKIHEFQESL